MKKIIGLLLTVLSTALVCAFAACEFNPFAEKEEPPTFTWSETVDQDREVGTVFNMSGIWGKYGDSYIAPTISVLHDGEAPEYDAENRILPLYDLGEYEITLKFDYKDEKEAPQTATKRFIVTAVDTTAPTIAKISADRLFAGKEIDLAETFTAYDAIDKENVTTSFAVTSPSGDKVTVEDGKFTATEFGDYLVELTAADSRNNSVTKEYSLYVRDAAIFESFRIEDESGAKGYSTSGRDFAISEKYAEGDGECLYFVSVEDYNHDYVQFSNSLGVDWSATNGMFFTVYNASDEDVYLEFGGMLEHLDIWGKNVVVATLKGNSRNTVFVSNKDLASITSNGEKYLYAEICYERNGGTGFKTGQIELYFDDVTYATEEAVREYATSLSAKEINGGAILTDSEIEKDGVTLPALNFKPNGTWIRFYFTYSNLIEWSKIKKFTVNVYNPLDTAVGFRFGKASDISELAANNIYGSQLVTAQPGWNTFTIDTSAFEDGDYLFVGIASKEASYGNSADNYEAFAASGIFFAPFDVTYYTVTDVPADNEEVVKDNVIEDNY